MMTVKMVKAKCTFQMVKSLKEDSEMTWFGAREHLFVEMEVG